MSGGANGGDAQRMGVLLHVPLHLTVELGSCEMTISDVLKIGAGSILELDRAADHPVELLVNGRPVARGEIIAVEESFGLHVTELLAP
ncbi:MAG TPA: flagellar motor switch protein FliN [Candidatus Binatia bacterium]|nr:flagellar motor switch protein FliN [Candidatus Binatia bacterium]